MNILIPCLVFISVFLIMYNLVEIIFIKGAAKLQNLSKKEKIRIIIFSQTFLDSFREIFLDILNSSSPLIKNYKNKIEPLLKLAQIQNMNLEKFFLLQILAGFVSMLFFVVILGVDLFFVPVCIIGAFILPVFWLKSKIKQRNKIIFRTLPDVLDTIILCIKAGLDFSAALNKYVEKGQKGPLYDELFTVQKQIQMGKNRTEALEEMIERTQHPQLTEVVNSLVQSLKLGSSVVNVLKSQSEQLRIKRFQLAEKLAHEAPTKLLFPLVFFIFPTVFIILFVPIILSFLK